MVNNRMRPFKQSIRVKTIVINAIFKNKEIIPEIISEKK